jgi:GTP-binding protein LepA
MEIITQRLEREFALDIIATKPSVEYRVRTTSGEVLAVDSPSRLPPAGEVASIAEPMLLLSIIAPATYTGRLMDLCQTRRGRLDRMDYLSTERVELRYRLPLSEVVTDFYDQLKSRTRGYASLDYEADGYEDADMVRVDILLQYEPVDAFSAIVHRSGAYAYGRNMTAKLRELIPRQQFDVPIQAAIGSRVIARETVRAYRKDVTAKLYGGDVTRKRKLLSRQKAGKRRMKAIGNVDVPPEAFISAMRIEQG